MMMLDRDGSLIQTGWTTTIKERAQAMIEARRDQVARTSKPAPYVTSLPRTPRKHGIPQPPRPNWPVQVLGTSIVLKSLPSAS